MPRKPTDLIWTAAVAAVLLCARFAVAQISPGELSRFHAKLEGISNCTSCHELRREVSPTACLNCHTALRTQINKDLGYHASGDVKGHNCRECHSEHNGRDYELIHWKGSREQFNHGLAGFKLEGAHAKQDCRACHKSDFVNVEKSFREQGLNRERTFLGLRRECLSCHADEHGDQLTDNCLDCHTFEAWAPAPKYTHEKSRYPLTGRHADVACDKCHFNLPAPTAASNALIQKKQHAGTQTKYNGLTFPGCADCHSDVHEGKFGTVCSECHTTAGFQQIVGTKFDHSLTKFPLEGKHKGVNCQACHTSGNMTVALKHEHCANCHKDAHHGQYADRASNGACEECHTVNGFVPSLFDISRHDSTRYPLTGSHLAIPCFACHKQVTMNGETYAQYTFPETRCQTCHADVHQGQLDHWIKKSGCEFCHNTESWHRTSFDHKLARFPLEGKHREILCLKCHKVVQAETGTETLWIKPLTMDCAGCHKDIHNGQFVRTELGETQAACDRCHEPDGWPSLEFEHNRDSRFALDGAHAKVACSECHKPVIVNDSTSVVRYKPLGTACADCHGS